ncbi:MAG: hypothetical protein ACTSVO_05720 [Candidatus Heimdallarchaeaceae archaeon]
MSFYTSSADASTRTWSSWNNTSNDYSATSTASTSDYTWSSWNSGTTSWDSTTTTDSTATIWVSWNADDPSRYTIKHTIPYEPTQEELEERRQRIRDAQREAREEEERAKKREEEKEAAELRAKELLLDLIGEEQLKIYNDTGRLFVKGKQFDYVVRKTGFIQKLEKNKIQDICVHLGNRYKYPETDNVIAMKLLIENEENKMLKLANNQGSRERPEELELAACM